MSADNDHIYLTMVFAVWEFARWQEIIDWAVGLIGALSLIVRIEALAAALTWRRKA